MNGRTVILAATVVVAAGTGGSWLIWGGNGKAIPPGVLVASGRLEGRSFRISAETGGRITRAAMRRGDIVAPGALIAEIDRRPVETSVAGARAALAAADAAVVAAAARIGALDAQLHLAKTETARYRRLFERDAAPRQALDRAEAERSSLEAQLEAAEASKGLAARQADLARAELDAALLRLEKTTVTAPVAGQVTAVLAREGEVVPAGGPILQVVSLDPMRLRIFLPLESAGQLRTGAAARVYVDAYPNRLFAGTVERIAGEAEFTPKDVHMPDDRNTLVYAVDIHVPNPDGALKDGFPADAYVRWDPAASWPDRRPW